MHLKVQMKHLYTNSYGIGNKEEELETIVHLEDYGLSQKQGGMICRGVVLCVKKWIDCDKLPLKNSQEQTESLWVKIRERRNKRQLLARV